MAEGNNGRGEGNAPHDGWQQLCPRLTQGATQESHEEGEEQDRHVALQATVHQNADDELKQ